MPPETLKGREDKSSPEVPVAVVQSDAGNEATTGESIKPSNDAGFGPALAPQHLNLIRDSAISPEVSRARGYRTVTSKAELGRLGFSDAQRRVPALLIPIYGIDGTIASYQSRADEPRIRDGKAIKYETPQGARMALDVPPTVRASGDLRHGAKPLVITEGVRKADAGASAGLCIVGLLGVWNFRGTNEVGGKTALGEWESIDLKGRRVCICFDSDVMTKPQVSHAMERLKGLLESRGAGVELIYLPDAEGGTKQGLDDYLASGETVESLFKLATKELRKPPEPATREIGTDYFVADGATYHIRTTRDGTFPALLANFSAKLVADVSVDDGVESRREFEIEATIEDQTVSQTVAASAFHSMNWPVELLGARAILAPGQMTREHLRFAIQTRNRNVDRRTVYTHTGWRELRGHGFCYLHADGACGPEGPVVGVQTRLPDMLAPFSLPEPPEGMERIRAIVAALDLLKLGAPRIMFPLLASGFRAIHGHCDLSLFIAGVTGIGKTEAATLVQSFFAQHVTVRTLPCGWSGTANSNEVAAFHAKDALLVVDDFKPVGSANEVSRTHASADRLLRAQGNQKGRSRMNADGSLRAEKSPRGLILSTGEDVPAGTSLAARMVVLEVKPGEILLSELSRCQADSKSGLYAKAMAGFIKHMAGRYAATIARFAARAEELRTMAKGVGGHARTPTNIAGLQASMESFIAYAQEVGAIDEGRATELRESCWKALLDVAEQQTEHQTNSDEVENFLRYLRAAIASGAAHIAGKNGEPPASRDPKACGWRQREPGSDATLMPQGTRIGWIDGEDLYLITEVAYATAQKIAAEAERLTSTKRTLVKRIDERGLLVTKGREPGKRTARVFLEGIRRDVLHIRANLLADQAPEAHQAQNDLADLESAGPGPESRARDAGAASSSGPPVRPKMSTPSAPEWSLGHEGPEGPELGTRGSANPTCVAGEPQEAGSWKL